MKKEQGNILYMILIAVALLAMLTMAISRSSTEQSNVLASQTQDDQINRMMAYVSALGQAIQQMAINGENTSLLYNRLDISKPGDAGFEGSPTNLKIYHPTGGGVTYLSASSADANAVATAYNIDANARITGVGATDVTVGDIVFTAKISTAALCGRINQKLSGSSTVPTMTAGTFTTLFTNDSSVTVDGTNCASCVNKAQLCVSNGAGAWGFYAALFPG